ncbi:MAG: regulatory protein RecX [Candidatus Zixiibacteriota bacterium]
MSLETPVKITKLVSRESVVMVTVTGFNKPLPVSPLVAYELRLVEGIVLTTSQIERLKGESERFTCEQTAIRMLALRDHSIGELKAKLLRKGIGTESVTAAIKSLRERGYLDDQKYALSYAERLVRERPCGQAYLIGHLMKKQINRRIAEDTATMVLQSTSEMTLAIESLRRRWRLFSQFELEVAQRKAYTYLSGRGFGYAAAKAAFEHLNRKKDEDSD